MYIRQSKIASHVCLQLCSMEISAACNKIFEYVLCAELNTQCCQTALLVFWQLSCQNLINKFVDREISPSVRLQDCTQPVTQAKPSVACCRLHSARLWQHFSKWIAVTASTCLLVLTFTPAFTPTFTPTFTLTFTLPFMLPFTLPFRLPFTWTSTLPFTLQHSVQGPC